MPDSADQNDQQVLADFGKALTFHGYGLHYRLLQLVYERLNEKKSSWELEADEFPVEVQGKGTRIDFILRNRDNPRLYLLAECKQANPAFANWCFARGSFRSDESYVLEGVERSENGSVYACIFEDIGPYVPFKYHIGLPIKTSQESNGIVQGEDIVEEAATQIMHGLNGIIELLLYNTQILKDYHRAVFIPVVFTDAKLWVANTNLYFPNIEDGNVRIEGTDFGPRKWLAFQYHQLPVLKHNLSFGDRPKTFGGTLDFDYVRTIFIVSTSGIELFLGATSQPHFFANPI